MRIYDKDKPGTPVIAIHGGPGSSTNAFYKTVSIANDRPVVYYNQLGSALTEFAPEYKTAEQIQGLLTVERFVDELDAVVKHFKFKEYSLIGHSWGSMLATSYYLEKKPVGLKSLVLVGSFLSVNLWLLDAERLIKTLSPDLWVTIEESMTKNDFSTKEYEKVNAVYSENFLCRTMSLFDSLPKEPAPSNAANVDVYQYMWGPTEFTCTGTLKGRDLTSRLGEVKVPVLYVSGEFDSGSPAASNYYKTLTPNAEVVVLSKAAHMSYLDNPSAFNYVVRGFLNKIDK